MGLQWLGLNQEEQAAVEEIQAAGSCGTVEAVHEERDRLYLAVGRKNGQAYVRYSTRASLLRAAAWLDSRTSDFEVEETASFTRLGAMLDNSRNAVMTVETVKDMCRLTARMGCNMLMLYTEDTYEMDGHPYFGYMRGRYTAEELREMDEYAALLGIELVPCIQTLAHLGTIFRWQAYVPLRDCGDILLAGDDRTYRLIADMLDTLSSCLRSRRIHIGMDEAHMLGLGEYLRKNGFRKRTDIMLGHLEKVTALCRERGYEPIMWSDMFFRLASETGQYYDPVAEVPGDLAAKVPPEIAVCYWDYYHTDPAVYDGMIAKHRKLSNPLWFAGGAWIWSGMTPLNRVSLKAARAAADSLLRNRIERVIVTVWGDDGAACSRYAALATLQLYAEAGWSGKTDPETLSQRLAACAGANAADFEAMELPNYLPGREDDGELTLNPSRYLLFQDPLLGLFDRHVPDGSGSYYDGCAQKMAEAAARGGRWAYLFETLEALCRVLEIKADLGVRLKKAYDNRDTAALRRIAGADLPALSDRLTVLYETFRRQWFTENKPFGWEVQTIRLGGLQARVQETVRTVEDYLEGRQTRIPELEEPRLFYDGRAQDETLPLALDQNVWKEIVTASVL